MTTLQVLFPQGEDARDFLFRDWSCEDETRALAPRLTTVMEVEIDDVLPQALEEVFAIGNSYPGEMVCAKAHSRVVKEWRDRGLRSFSVGDVVGVEGRYYICGAVGFKEIDVAHLVESRRG